ncbi:MAG: IS5/IS1182 family transposase, partial [Prevotella sp.]|nr:IS5/IS1182 family transposase [Prevotella sp.]
MLNRTSRQLSLFSSLEDMLNHQHPLFQLGHKINRQHFDDAFSPLYCSTNG